jgi:Cu+-exporting ATPase
VLKNCEGNADGDILICVNGKVEGSIWVEDKIRDDAKEVISKLKDMGKEVYIATGDPSSSAEEAGKELGVKVYKGLSPEDKVDIVKELRKRGVTVFIGDGVNDAEAIKEADIGIAISSGTEIAKYAGDITIPSINSLLTVFRYGKRAVSKIKQNLIWAFAYNSVLVSIAAGVLYPIYLPPEYAALAMSMDSVSVVLWSMIR